MFKLYSDLQDYMLIFVSVYLRSFIMAKKLSNRVALSLAPVMLLSLGACAAPFQADVSRFQQLPAPQGQSFSIATNNEELKGGLEFAQYAGLVSEQMQQLGYTPAASGSNADLVVKLDYGVDDGEERTVVRGSSFRSSFGFGRRGFGRHGFGRRGFGRRGFGRRGFGRRGFHSSFIFGYHDPFLYGGHGFGGFGDIRSYTVYKSNIDLKIENQNTGERLFEGKANAESRSNNLTYLVPNLVDAMFTNFPGGNGETLRISIAPESKKKKVKKVKVDP